MDYKEFKEEIKNRIKEFLPEEFKDHRADVLPLRKNNGVVKDGLTISGGEQLVPVIHLNGFYGNYQDGTSVENIMVQIAAAYKMNLETYPGLGAGLLQYEEAKGHLTVTVCNAQKNEALLKRVPHERKEDLALIYRVKRQMPDQGWETAIVSRDMLKQWNVGEQELKEEAWNRMKKDDAPYFRSINDALHDSFPDIPLFQPETGGGPSIPFYVLTNQNEMWGAAYMFDKETMAAISEELDRSLVILPSSLHEVLIIPETEDMDVEELQEMVKSINETVLEEQDVLSDNVYRYDKDRQTLTVIRPMEQAQGMSLGF